MPSTAQPIRQFLATFAIRLGAVIPAAGAGAIVECCISCGLRVKFRPHLDNDFSWPDERKTGCKPNSSTL